MWIAVFLATNAQAQEYVIQDGDVITINADTLEIKVDVTDEEMGRRREAWVMPPFKYTRGTMARYIKTVSSAQMGCVTDE